MAVVTDPVSGTGITGLDAILGGGFPKDHVYLVQGDPGAGKTTLSLQFLIEGAKKGERALYITLSETKKELEAVARSHDWSLDGVEIHEQLVREETLSEEAVARILEEVTRVNPQRVVIDSLAEIRLLSQSKLRHR